MQVIARNGEPIGFEPSPRWVRVMFRGVFVADSKRVQLLLPGGPPTYYFPREDVRMDLLLPSGHTESSPLLGDAAFWSMRVDGKTVEDAAWTYAEPSSEVLDLSGFVAFRWDKMDAWFEEGEEVYIHAHDPHKRIDILQSPRRVRVVVLGETVAESAAPVLLFETGLPTRYYFSRIEVRQDLLERSDRVTGCAYKGKARYFSVRVGDKIARDIAWYYTYPAAEAAKVAGRIAFFNEKVDSLFVDGVEQARPRTPWST